MRLAGILLLLLGAIYPIASLLWLNARIRRGPRWRPGQVSVILAFNGVFPVAIIGLGAGLLSARLWGITSYRMALVLVALVALGLLLAAWRQGAKGRDKEGEGGRGAAGADF